MTVPDPPPPCARVVVPTTTTRRIWGALVVAAAVELLLFAPAILWLAGHDSPPPVQSAWGPVQLDLSKLPTPEAAAAAPPAPAPPAEPEAAQQPAPAPDPIDTSPGQLADRAPVETPSRSVPPTHYVTAPAPLPLPDLSLLPHDATTHIGPQQAAPPLANGRVPEPDDFSRKLNEALREASRKLNSSRGIKLTGRVLIVMHYRDGKAWGPQVLRSSGFAELDQAAIDGVAQAKWPPAPHGLEGRELVIPIMGSFF
ncbi:MAG: hypothetical protein P4M07_04975 [Xanthobacteraceae bacterium]|nr:hypothetical protein [Xanthobacteraceae bacterium]